MANVVLLFELTEIFQDKKTKTRFLEMPGNEGGPVLAIGRLVGVDAKLLSCSTIYW